MSKIYLKTYCYAPHEIDFIVANLAECYDHIEKMIVCEFDINHTGVKRDFEYTDLKDRVPEHLRDKLDYHACEVFNETARAYEDEDAIHNVNEPVMRSYFTKLYDFNDDDIIISIVSLKLRQFFYKKTYLWENNDFTSPIATYYGAIPQKYPSNWRDIGKVTDDYVGCHFSWCMTPDEMVHKLHTYSHPRYRFCANKELVESAIENKEYPFDPSVDFRIRELEENDPIIPESIRSMLV